ncbi:SR-related and CTD-associated factor 8-like [Corticium candelabrum]|uniref:SR-related and CTD-associated factor 8-like n=1 Tax=Corticium candelabrum TaxID=121492 RepID=UPI002E270EBB|nr:SR-related and CTD-associated factor 8-like [Corticium candelabrum]
MEHVEEFKKELFSIYETRPPVSKNKIVAITKLAIRSVKHYKHVVQIVEKMIAKCRPDYKVPGCYVIDSIIRKSRNKFGVERDMYSPRFAKNLLTTTRNLMQCIPGDEENIIRVLTIWQSKQLFSDDVTNSALALARQLTQSNKSSSTQKELAYTTADHTVSSPLSWASQMQSLKPSADVPAAPLPQYSTYGGFMPSTVTNDATSMGFWPQAVDVSQYAHGYVDDFDYEDDESDRENSTEIQPLNRLQTQLQTQQENRQLPNFSSAPTVQVDNDKAKQPDDAQNEDQPKPPPPDSGIVGRRIIARFQKKQKVLQDDDMEVDDLSDVEVEEKSNGNTKNDVVRHDGVAGKERVSEDEASGDHSLQWRGRKEQSGVRKRTSSPAASGDTPVRVKRPSRWGELPADMSNVRDDDLPVETPHEWSRDMSRGDGGRLSSERHDYDDVWSTRRDDETYNDRRDDRHDDRRMLFERHRDDGRWWDEEQRDYRGQWQSERQEDMRHSFVDGDRHGYSKRDRDRRSGRSNFPVARKDAISVCSCTVWVGHLKKIVSDKQVRGLFEDYGDVQSVDMVPPRGCAYVCMERRIDAARALEDFSSRKVSIGRQACKFAWALPKGCSSYREYWNEPLGVVYLPLSKVSGHIDLTSLSKGSILDPVTIPDDLMEEYEAMLNEEDALHQSTASTTAPTTAPTSSPTTTTIKPPTTEPVVTTAMPPTNPPIPQLTQPPNTAPMMPMMPPMPPHMHPPMPGPPMGPPMGGLPMGCPPMPGPPMPGPPMGGPMNHPPYSGMPEPVRYGFMPPFEQRFPQPWTVRHDGFLNRPRFA